MYVLPPALRSALAKPMGPVLTTEAALAAVEGHLLVAVGDVVTRTFLERGLRPALMVVDGKTHRTRPVDDVGALAKDARLVRVANPPATITRALWDAVADALAPDAPARAAAATRGTLVHVDGEEDLAVLPALALAPEGARVAYGQPNEGVVVVTVNEASRARARELLKAMEAP
ncbi:MAG TPA: DUF359 domain-containing protein [Candidatus Thermoplasmatota archaeon]|nr:DUF359 domain-containing protein [Candidatus Thermoplasmatota archaeon]HVL86762.1 DUF359 domain-containing protein [Candidatus Thermoplasmatota archaeon]